MSLPTCIRIVICITIIGTLSPVFRTHCTFGIVTIEDCEIIWIIELNVELERCRLREQEGERDKSNYVDYADNY